MLIHNAQVTGSLTLNGIDIGDITGSEASIGALNSFSASINVYTGSNNTNINALHAFSSSILTYTGSNDALNNTQNSRLSALETTSGSLLTASGSFSTRVTNLETASGSFSTRVSNTETTASSLVNASSSFSTRVTNNESTGSNLVAASASFSTRVANTEATASSLTTASGSFSTRTTNLETASGSFSTRVTSNESNISALQTASGSFSTRVTNNESNISALQTASGSFSTRVTNAESSITSLNSRTGSYATTGSNIFNGTQTITGSLFVTQNLTVLGSSSISYVSQSTLNIGTNLITVNAQNPSIRFGGLAVIDSGSVPQVSGSWLFDSIQNRWIMIHQQTAGGVVTSSIALMGPETYNNLGNETQITQNRLVKGVAGASGEHIGDSNISDTGTVVSINSNTQVTGSLNVGGASTFGSSASNGDVTIISNSSPFLIRGRAAFDRGFLGLSWDVNPDCGVVITNNLRLNTNATPGSNAGSTAMFISGSGCIGIGTTSPSERLHVEGNVRINSAIVSAGAAAEFLTTGYAALPVKVGSLWVSNTYSGTAPTNGAYIAGNVGIGTTNPGAKLQVVGGVDVVGSISYSGVVTSGGLGGRLWVPGQAIGQASNAGLYGLALTYLAKYDSGWKSVGGGYASAVTVDEGIFSFSNSQGVGAPDTSLTWTTRLMIDTDGKVGIGTTTANGVLDISSGLRTGTTTGIFFGADVDVTTGTRTNNTRKLGLIASPHYSNATRPVFGIAMDNQVSNNFIYIGGAYSGYNAATAIAFFTGTTTTTETGTERLRINANGDIGIGNTSPTNYNTYTTVHIGDASKIGLIKLGTGASTNGPEIFTNSNNNLFFLSNNADIRMTISGSGNIGIGTTSPVSLLNVHGSDPYFVLNNTAGNDFGIKIRHANSETHGLHLLYNANAATASINNTYPVTPGQVWGDIYFRQNVGGTMTSRMMIKADGGSVGIGTTSPSNRLTVHQGGGVRVTGIANGSYIELSGDLPGYSSNQFPVIKSDGTIHFANNGKYSAFIEGADTYFGLRNNAGTNQVFLNTGGNSYFNGGNVGIGSTSPSFRLDVNGTVRIVNTLRIDGFDTVSAQRAIGFGGNTLNTNPTIYSNGSYLVITTATGQPLYLNSDSNGPVLMSGTGNVGIGTTSFGASGDSGILQVRGNIGIIANTSGYSWLNLFTGTSGNYWHVSGRSSAVGDAERLGFYRYNGSYSAELISLTTSGNVGIGTTSPSSGARLDVMGQTRTNTAFFRSLSGTSVGFIGGYSDWTGGSADSNMAIGTYQSVMGFFTNNSVTERMRITSDGNVGIGTTNPITRLTVSNGGANTSTNYQFRNISVTSGFLGGYTGTAIQSLLAGFDGSIYGTDIGYGYDGAGYTLMFSTNDDLSGNPIERMRITSTGTVQPGANGTQDLGSSSLRWSTVFTSDLSLSNGIGDYTIVEGENDLFLYNNKQNKVYKFVVEEVDPSTATPKKS